MSPAVLPALRGPTSSAGLSRHMPSAEIDICTRIFRFAKRTVPELQFPSVSNWQRFKIDQTHREEQHTERCQWGGLGRKSYRTVRLGALAKFIISHS
jgi:hypothetical protein